MTQQRTIEYTRLAAKIASSEVVDGAPMEKGAKPARPVVG